MSHSYDFEISEILHDIFVSFEFSGILFRIKKKENIVVLEKRRYVLE